MPFKKGDFILIDYVARVSETGDIFDTTIEEVAKEEGIYKEGALYEPMLVVVGEGWVLKALDEGLLNLEPGKKERIEIPPEKGFGERDPNKIRLYPLRKLRAQGITPQVGMQLQVDGRLATVRTIGSGRVLLDFNPPLAGKTLIYEVTVQRRLRTSREKISALIHRRIPQVDIGKFKITIKKNGVTVTIPEEAFYIEGLQLAKRGIFMDITRFFPEKRTVTFMETFKKPEPAEAAPSSEGSRGSTQRSE
ncbi:MAG: FKBP-type peptidyl-prolyl cis-trans isomerase [Candidatus Bathyarchaeota archaeon B63]|nr:MAG: FKBP-type peptidyl-prolyl cis-trans isomerase [Candidatus Bathyarchaeota archaeon B63]